jgi:hypothetical protein
LDAALLSPRHRFRLGFHTTTGEPAVDCGGTEPPHSRRSSAL